MSNDLIAPGDLAHLAGAPFTEEEVDTAVAALRGELGWHIAPEITETIALDVTVSEPVLRLPTRHLVSVDEIRNTATDAVIDPGRYRVSRALSRVRYSSYWPAGYESVEVDLTHGFDACPPELYPIVSQAITGSRGGGGTVTSESVGPFSVTYSSDSAGTVTPVQQDTLDRYSVRTSWPARL